MSVDLETLSRDLHLAQSECSAWRDVFLSIEAHILDRIAMGDAANPERYLRIIRANVVGVDLSSKQIYEARSLERQHLLERIAELEAERAWRPIETAPHK